jgi:hypothetical protein
MEQGCAGCMLVSIMQPDAPTDHLSIHTGGNVDAALVVLVTGVGVMINPEILGAVPSYAGGSLIEILEGVCRELGVEARRDRAAGMPITFDLGARTARMDSPRMGRGPTLAIEDWLGMSGALLLRRKNSAAARVAAALN